MLDPILLPAAQPVQKDHNLPEDKFNMIDLEAIYFDKLRFRFTLFRRFLD